MGKLKEGERLQIYSMGKRFEVTAICQSTDEANAYMAAHKDEAVIAEIHGFIYVANVYEAKPRTDLDGVLKPFLGAASMIPDHWNGALPLNKQVLAGLRYPTGDDYRALAKAVNK